MTDIRQYKSVPAGVAALASAYFPYSPVGVGTDKRSVARHDYFGDWKVSAATVQSAFDTVVKNTLAISEIYY